MSLISNIAIHHGGGIQRDPYASTRHLTAQDISRYHRSKDDWGEYPSRFIDDEALRYMGYNAAYDWKNRGFYQGRAIGEMTIAQKGHNYDTFSLLVIGNYTRQPIGTPTKPVDPFTADMLEDITKYLYDLINGNKRGLIVAPNTTINLSISRVNPHRFYQPYTECYGTFFADDYFRKKLIAYKPAQTNEKGQVLTLQERLKIQQEILRIYFMILDLYRKQLAQSQSLGAEGDRGCEGFIG